MGWPQAFHLWQSVVLLKVLDMTKLVVNRVQVLEAEERGLKKEIYVQLNIYFSSALFYRYLKLLRNRTINSKLCK